MLRPEMLTGVIQAGAGSSPNPIWQLEAIIGRDSTATRDVHITRINHHTNTQHTNYKARVK